jgi:RNA polymerase sigma-70 factor, ECF subfamily
VAEGDERALSELYDRYSRPVYATGIRLLRDVSLAEELVQDVFTNVWRRAGKFDPERASFATWLYRITHNRVVDLARKRKVRPVSVGEDPLQTVPGGPEPEASVDSWDMARALSRIPGEHWEVLTLAYFQGLTHNEISQRTGVPLGTIKSRITAALKKFHQAMVTLQWRRPGVTEDRFWELLGPYVLGELSAEEEREMERHLDGCAGCRSDLDQVRQTHARLREEAATVPPPELKARVLARATGEAPTRSGDGRRLWIVAAALLVIAVVGVGLLWATLDDSSSDLPLTATALAPGASGVVRGEPVGENIRIELEVQGLPELGEDEYYEMWYYTEEEDGGGRISCGAFRTAPEGQTTVNFTTPLNARDYPEIEVTCEPDDGDPASSGEAVLEGDLRDA